MTSAHQKDAEKGTLVVINFNTDFFIEHSIADSIYNMDFPLFSF